MSCKSLGLLNALEDTPYRFLMAFETIYSKIFIFYEIIPHRNISIPLGHLICFFNIFLRISFSIPSSCSNTISSIPSNFCVTFIKSSVA